MFRRACLVLVMLVPGWVLGPAAQAPRTDEAAWQAFMTWMRTAPLVRTSPFAAYAAALEASGVPAAEARRQVGALMATMRDRTDWVEVYYDRAFGLPVSGNPEVDGFKTARSALVAEAVEGLPPGAALDAGMGQGRNAVYLARLGWRVTGFDLSGVAIDAALSNARAAGVRIDAVKASHAAFDFGTSRWDLIVLVFAWAPIDDPAFVARLEASLRPGGRLVFEHFVDDPANPRPAAMHALKPGQLRALLSGFRLDRYEELTDIGDWGGPDSRLVRAVAVRR